MSAGVLSMDELVVALVLSWPFSYFFFFFCTARRALVYTRGSRLISISLLLSFINCLSHSARRVVAVDRV